MPRSTPNARPAGPRGTADGAGARRRTVGPAAVALLVVALSGALVAPVGAQTDPADPGSTTTSTPPPASSTTTPPAGPGAGVPAPTTTVPTEVVELDIASIDALLAEARAQARKLRDVQIAGAVESVRIAEAQVGEALARLADATARRDEAAAVVAAQEAEVERVRRRIGAIAADAYMRVGTDDDDQVARLRLGDGGQDSAAVDAQQTAVYAGEAVVATRADLRAARDRLAEDEAARRAAQGVVEVRQGEVDTIEAAADTARAAEQVLREAPLDVPSAASVSSLFGSVGPTLLGRSLLTAGDLAAFARSRGTPHPSVQLDALAVSFIEEGEAEGVRADLAWAQSIIETGYFGFAGSMVAPTDHNYAGIGACDTCSTGHSYPTPQLGVRAQIQLLRTYADRSATAATLARPPAGRAPEKVGVRGCCATWMALSGVWATGPGYGAKILTLYNDMLKFAVQRRLAGETDLTPEQLAAVSAPAPGTTLPEATLGG